MPINDSQSDFEVPPDLVVAVRSAKHIAVLTGAGVSAESGIPTFRDALTGHWAKHRPEDLATPEAFAADPERVSQWYDHRRLMCLQCEPNPGHLALARLQKLKRDAKQQFTIITQNVDRLHQRAGSKSVLELHGSLMEWRCVACHTVTEELGDAFTQFPPRCSACGGQRRPNVVWFGEVLPESVLNSAGRAAATCDLFFSIGTSSVVYPAAGLVDAALSSGARVVEINTKDTPKSGCVHWPLRGSSALILLQLVAQLA